jgi:hypothetical protein
MRLYLRIRLREVRTGFVPTGEMMDASRRRVPIWITPTLLLGILACAAALWITPFGLLPRNALAQARWRAQGIRHYRMTASLSEGWIASGPWTVEVSNERVVGGYDATSGAPLNGVQLRVAQRILPVDVLFASIESELDTPTFNSSRALLTRLARAVPALRDQLDHCAARMPKLAYDPRLGYPSGITVYASPCFPGGDRTVLITKLTPLP